MIAPERPGREASPAKEPSYHLKCRIVISGPSGTGKTTVMELLARKYGLAEGQTKKVGDEVRILARQASGEEVTGFFERSIEVDRELDKRQLALLSDPNPQNVLILESRLGGFLVYRLRNQYEADGRTPPPIVTTLFQGDKEVLYQRVHKRDHKIKPTLTFEQSRAETIEREEQDLLQLRKAHPELEGVDPLSPESRYIYDLYVDTTDMSAQQVAQYIHSELLARGAISSQAQ